MSALLGKLAALRYQAERRRRNADDWRDEGDFITAQRCTDYADGIEHASVGIEDALFDAFDLWDQYEQQDP